MINIGFVEDISGFPKSQRSSSKDENSASYGLHKLGKVMKNAWNQIWAKLHF